MEHVMSYSDRVLFVDDEAAIMEVWSEILSRMGYQVTGISDSRAALAAFERDPSVFDVIVTDYVMPGMDGQALIRQIHKIRPDIPVIMITGFSMTVTLANFRGSGIKEFMTKPVSPASLDSAIRRALSDA